MKTKWMALVILAGILMTGGSLFAQSHFSVGIGIGSPGYYAPPPVVAYRPPYPGPGYYWVDGYYNPYNIWVPGYWAPPALGFGFVGPRYYPAPRFYGGYRPGFSAGFRGRHSFVGGHVRGHR